MLKNKYFYAVVSMVLLLTLFPVQASFDYSDGVILKRGMRGPDVSELQQDLKDLGFLSIYP